jgi:hypothetical protein
LSQVNVDWMGWACLLGGALGAFRVATAKVFYKSDFMDSDGVITEQDRTTEITVTPLKRWLIVLGCVGLAIYGAIRIQDRHNWNPFNTPESAAESTLEE